MNRTKYLLTADDVKDYLECSRDHAYKVIKKLNLELASMEYIKRILVILFMMNLEI